MNMNDVIEIEGLCKTYAPSRPFGKPFQALSDVSLSVRRGEVFGFIGPNGAGKSTTIKILTGVLHPTQGRARIFGRDVSTPEARRGLGYVPESPALYDYLTPLELLEMGMAIHRVVKDGRRAHAMRWLERLGLAHVVNKRIRSFSKGMVQRTALAHALAVEPQLLILDEPLSGLDPVGRKDVVDILEEYRNAGGSIFLTSHVLHDVERLADRFGLIGGGRLLSVQASSEFAERSQTVAIRSLGQVEVSGFTRQRNGQWVAVVDKERVWDTLESLRVAGHSVIEVRPTLNLESLFFSQVQQQETVTS